MKNSSPNTKLVFLSAIVCEDKKNVVRKVDEISKRLLLNYF